MEHKRYRSRTAPCTCRHLKPPVASSVFNVVQVNMPGRKENGFVTKLNFSCKISSNSSFERMYSELLCLELLHVATFSVCELSSQNSVRCRLWHTYLTAGLSS
jgi:hypothetical protein